MFWLGVISLFLQLLANMDFLRHHARLSHRSHELCSLEKTAGRQAQQDLPVQEPLLLQHQPPVYAHGFCVYHHSHQVIMLFQESLQNHRYVIVSYSHPQSQSTFSINCLRSWHQFGKLPSRYLFLSHHCPQERYAPGPYLKKSLSSSSCRTSVYGSYDVL